jgi:hypothetical protein
MIAGNSVRHLTDGFQAGEFRIVGNAGKGRAVPLGLTAPDTQEFILIKTLDISQCGNNIGHSVKALWI